MRHFIFILFWLFLVSPSWATIASVGSLGSNTSASSGTTLVITTDATLEAGNEGFVFVSFDNTGTTDADFSEISSVVDSASNTWVKLCEYTNGNGTPAAGITASAYKTRATSQLTSGGTITITFANTISNKVARAWEFTATNSLSLVGTCQQAAGDAIDPPSQEISGLTSAETLFLRVIGEDEGSDDGDLTVTTNYTALTYVNKAPPNGRKFIGEFRILTGTGDTSNPSHTNDGDTANLFFALQESAGATARKIPSVMY